MFAARHDDDLSRHSYFSLSHISIYFLYIISVAISGDTIIVGAIQQNSPGMKGKAYIITRVGTTWTQMAILEPHAAAPDGVCFGSSVSVDNGVAVVGTNGGDHFGYTVTAGLAYVFTGSGATWTRDAVLENDPLADELCFGCAVAVKDGNVLVGVKDMYGETYNDGTAQFWGYGPQDGYPGGKQKITDISIIVLCNIFQLNMCHAKIQFCIRRIFICPCW